MTRPRDSESLERLRLEAAGLGAGALEVLQAGNMLLNSIAAGIDIDLNDLELWKPRTTSREIGDT